MTKQEKVAAWLKSLGYSRPPGAEDIWHKEGAPWVSDEQATFFYDVMVEAETNAVAWSVGVIDDLHMNPSGVNDLMDIDRTYKGIKNAIRDRYKHATGTDPAPSYPVKATLRHLKQEGKTNG